MSLAFWWDVDGKHTRVIGKAWVQSSAKRTARGAVIWHAADGHKPDETTGATVGLEFWRARERLPSELLDVFPRPVPPVDASGGLGPGFPLQMHAFVPGGLPDHPSPRCDSMRWSGSPWEWLSNEQGEPGTAALGICVAKTAGPAHWSVWGRPDQLVTCVADVEPAAR